MVKLQNCLHTVDKQKKQAYTTERCIKMRGEIYEKKVAKAKGYQIQYALDRKSLFIQLDYNCNNH